MKLDDDEIIRDLIAWGQVLLQHDIRIVGAATEESVRKVFTDIVYDDMLAYGQLVAPGKKRKVFSPPPPATAGDNAQTSLKCSKVFSQRK